MKINGRVHCLFEQSGTFKREFIKLGIPAEDYDIQTDIAKFPEHLQIRQMPWDFRINK